MSHSNALPIAISSTAAAQLQIANGYFVANRQRPIANDVSPVVKYMGKS
jgi:hypothetical protein